MDMGFPILHCLLEFAQTHVHWVSDAIQPSYLQLPPSPAAPNLSQDQGYFFFCLQWLGSSHQVDKVLEFNLAWVFPMNIQGWFPLGLIGFSLWCPRDSKESSPALQFKSINSSLLRLLYYGPTLTSVHDCWKNHSFNYRGLYQQSDVSAF